jgi:hypothetical protein
MAAISNGTASSFPPQHSSTESDNSDERPDYVEDESDVAWEDFLIFREEVRS